MNVPVLVYHDVLSSEVLSRKTRRERFYSVSLDTFSDHMNFLESRGFGTIRIGPSACDFCHPIILTFDDGFESAYHCHRILRNHGLSGIFFVVTDFIGTRPYLNWEEIMEMDKNGMSIQSHTCSHPILTTMSFDQIRVEFDISKKTLEDRLGHVIDSLSIPQGFTKPEYVDIARQCGYQRIFTSQPGLYRLGSDSPIPRLSVYNETTLGSFRRLAYQNASEIIRQQCRKLILSVPKRLLGDTVYHALRLRILHLFDN
jgi:peptidoglycan/xylan/chitin deacetylase (PgdA/CDA1 family)